jgi:hypothetical protein
MSCSLQILGPQPRNQDIRPENDHEAARDHAAIGKHGDNPARHEKKGTHIAHIFKASG